jgi:hypothetical protein
LSVHLLTREARAFYQLEAKQVRAAELEAVAAADAFGALAAPGAAPTTAMMSSSTSDGGGDGSGANKGTAYPAAQPVMLITSFRSVGSIV